MKDSRTNSWRNWDWSFSLYQPWYTSGCPDSAYGVSPGGSCGNNCNPTGCYELSCGSSYPGFPRYNGEKPGPCSNRLYYVRTCNTCGKNWCTGWEYNEEDTESHYTETGISLVEHGCDGVSGWASAHSKTSGRVYAVSKEPNCG